MMGLITRAKRLYVRLPGGARSWAASAYGYYLRSVRYGGDVERRVAEALAREAWTPDGWRTWQDRQLSELLHHAATNVPYYREYWSRRREAGDDAAWGELRNWPILEKEALRRDPGAFVADGVNRARLLSYHTSGTTGLPITTWRSHETNRAWYALFEARNRRWYGLDRHARWAILGAQPVVPVEQRRPPFWVWNAGLRQLYLSAYHIKPENAAAYLDAMQRHRVEFLLGYPSSVYALAWMARDLGLSVPPLRGMISNAERLLPHQRQLIGAFFGCPVHDSYGMVEIVAGGSECEHGAMHLWPDAGVVEVLRDDDLPAPSGVSGALVCTGLLNRDMPLIRYRIGDRGALAPEDGTWGCGRRLPVLERIEGRSSDNVVTPDGRRVFALANLFDGLPIHERQMVQHTVDRFELAIVPDGPFGEAEEALLRERVRSLIGDVELTVRLVERVPRGPNGKLQTLVSRIAPNTDPFARPVDHRPPLDGVARGDVAMQDGQP